MNTEIDYETYLKRYCRNYGITKEEAEKHLVVRTVKRYYEDKAKGKAPNDVR